MVKGSIKTLNQKQNEKSFIFFIITGLKRKTIIYI